MRYADLQMHTVASDGTDTIDERGQDAREKGLDAIAITDHDTISDELTGRVDDRNGVEVITGAEIKCEINGTSIEVLGYFLDPQDNRLQELLAEVRGNRVERIDRFTDNLAAHHGIDIDTATVRQYADEAVGRPHLAEALIDAGYVETMDAAFNELIGDDCPAYVSTEKVPAERVITAIHDNGGYASLSHPGRSLPRDVADDRVAALADAGIDALEVEYTYEDKKDRGSFTIHFGEQYAAELADRYGLGWTGGSDCHGRRSDKYYLGDVKIPYDRITAMKDEISL